MSSELQRSAIGAASACRIAARFTDRAIPAARAAPTGVGRMSDRYAIGPALEVAIV